MLSVREKIQVISEYFTNLESYAGDTIEVVSMKGVNDSTIVVVKNTGMSLFTPKELQGFSSLISDCGITSMGFTPSGNNMYVTMAI